MSDEPTKTTKDITLAVLDLKLNLIATDVKDTKAVLTEVAESERQMMMRLERVEARLAINERATEKAHSRLDAMDKYTPLLMISAGIASIAGTGIVIYLVQRLIEAVFK